MPLGPRPDPIACLTQVAASSQGRAIREHILAALDLRAGQVALDVGCGPGTNLGDLADAVTGTGQVIGVDSDPVMVETASGRMAGRAAVEVRLGDAHALLLEDGHVDRARVDRVLQHVASAARVIAELRRVTRPGALVALGEPDWATADFTRYTCSEVVRNASIGWQPAQARMAEARLLNHPAGDLPRRSSA